MEAELRITKNSNKFRKPAIHFKEHGCYNFAPPGTSEYIKYWTEEATRCLDGYMAEDGESVSGYFYFYLNYYQISLADEIDFIDKWGKTRKKAVKIMDFPRFYDYDRYFFDAVEQAEIESKHLVVLKARRKGYSYKVAAMLIRNFYLIRESKNYALASEAEYLVRDGILSKAWDGMDFVDQNTAWFKKRQKTDTKMHKRASFVVKDHTGVAVEMGYKSEIMGVTLKNDPQKARGKSGKLIIFEEAGKFPKLLDAWQIARPSVEQGSHVYGMMIAFGTGGTEDANYEGLRQLFERPEAYNCMVFKNIWDDHLLNTKCGFFIPQYANLEGEDEEGNPFMDEDGNTIVNVSKKYILKKRDIVIENASDRRAIDRHIAEQPITPAEATLNISTNIFPKADLQNHLSFIRNHESMKNFKQVGELLFDPDGKLKWELNPRLKDLRKYRLDPTENRKGAVVVWEHPVDDPPYGLYIIGVDPYDHDQAGTDSLGSCIVYKRIQSFEAYYDLPVAEYTGRPETADEFYEVVRLLSLYYKANILYENEKKGLFTYFSNRNMEYLLADQPDIIKDIIKDSKVQRVKGMHMNMPIKDWGEGLIKDWLNEEYAPGKKNLTKIFSEPLLEELISYSPEGNFDRVMALMMVMIYIKELHHVVVKKVKQENKKKLFEHGIFRQQENMKLNYLNYG